ncbi:MAG TPA: SDR family NAD(P)-dependent oxidoreductase [Dehalococcoidia bacterium]|nr:SDR family NAD(P)-dependent oxidoreductase [Dehalococcoidia bacterium]
MGKLDGKVAVITGSARGIGKADALLFAQEGACVVVSDVDREPLVATAKEIEAAGGKVAWCIADVTKPEDTDKLMDTAVDIFGDLNILVNNAGIARDALLHKMTDTQWDMCLDIILKGTFNCVRSAAKYMMKKGHGGKIINTASVMGLMGNVGQVNYTAAKAGVIGLTKTVAREWARFGVNCNAIAYGFVHTRFTAEKETGEEVAGEKMGIPRKVRDRMLQEIGGKAITPEDAAKPALFLASVDSDFITGHVLNVSAGMYM